MPRKAFARICMPDPETFFTEYVFTGTPVIITNLFAGQEIRELNTIEAATAAFSNVKLLVHPEYVSNLDAPAEPEVMAFGDYWNHVRTAPGTRLLCSEAEIPARVSKTFKIPDVCLHSFEDREEVLALPKKYGDHDLLSNAFVANQGNHANLHYDGDHRQVILYQIFGRKEVILFPPRFGHRLRANEKILGFSGLSLSEMSDGQIAELLDECDGYRDVLQPGEAVYIPMLMWHYLKYLDHGMSINVRFGRNVYGRFFCVDNFQRDHYMHNFGASLVDPSGAISTHQGRLSEIINRFAQPDPDFHSRVVRIRNMIKDACRDLCPGAEVDQYGTEDNDTRDLANILKEIAGTTKLMYPDDIRKTRQTGAASSVQHRQISERSRALKYDGALLDRVIFNRVGKTDMSALSKAEACQMLNYLRSPGAEC